MRPIWSGSLSFGLVNIPVRLYSATASTGLRFNYLDKAGLQPIRYAKVSHEGRELASEEVVKGYEYRRGDYVVLTEEDFEKANVRRTHLIDIVEFCDAEEIPPVYYEKPYFLEPDRGADKAYALLREALKRSNKVAIARFVLRNREHLAAVFPQGDVLVLNQLRFKSEVREPEGLKLPQAAIAADREVDMALALIGQMTEPFDTGQFRDAYTEELQQIIEAKVQGKEPVARGEPPRPSEVRDVIEQLKASLERMERSKARKSA